MHPAFAATVERLEPSFQRLKEQPPIYGERFPLDEARRRRKIAGVYLMSEGDNHLYVGRSNDIAKRFYAHRRTSSGDGVAAFAYRLACLKTGRTAVSYRKGHGNGRAQKMSDPLFSAAFQAAKERIRTMSFRFVEEADPVNQAILEVYCAVALGTPHNTFDNH